MNMADYSTPPNVFSPLEKGLPAEAAVAAEATTGQGKRQEMGGGEFDSLRYTLSSLQLDDYAGPWASPHSGGLAGSAKGVIGQSGDSPPKGGPASSVMASVAKLSSPGTKGDTTQKSFTKKTVQKKNAQADDGKPNGPDDDDDVVKAAKTIQRAYRQKKGHADDMLDETDAAEKIQAAYRSFRERKQVLLRLQSHNDFLQTELSGRDQCLTRTNDELSNVTKVNDQLRKTVLQLRRQNLELTSSYDMRLKTKENQIEELDSNLHHAIRTSNDLKFRLDSNAVEYAKMAWDLKEKDSDSGQNKQYVLSLQRELESCRSQLSELHSAREADGIRTGNKEKECQELRLQVRDSRREAEAKAKEVDELRMRINRMQLHQQTPSSTPMTGRSASVGNVPPKFMMNGNNGDSSNSSDHHPPRAPSATGSHASVHPSNVKSIWSSSDNLATVPFGFFTQQGQNDKSNGSSKSGTPEQLPPSSYNSVTQSSAASHCDTMSNNGNSQHNHIKSMWNPINCDLDFLMSPTMMPLAAEPSLDYSNDSVLMRNSDGQLVTDDDMSSYGCNGRLLPSQEKNTAANLYVLVDKIVRTNDQPASLLLQQKLKTGNSEVKEMIFDAILGQALHLMKNRFGNFLMQRALEFGTPGQVRIIGQAMRGNVLNLACDRFGCHVVQKALDTVDEELRASLISELFRCIRETITHRFACHVWQRIFQIKWDGEPPAVMHYLDASLKGQWHSIANDENGSLVVQCIFENCSQREKAPILCEVLNRTVEVARGQWGNWVIQHILEHGAPVDKNYVMKVLVRHFYPMAIDQYASKVVEKGLKLAPKREMYDMIETVLAPSVRDGRPAILEMMNNQFANYVVQHILSLAEPQQKDVCIRLLLPHISTLRNSKYGQRVAAIVEKHLRNSHHKYGVSAGSGMMSPMPMMSSPHIIGMRG
ncbi:armadillo-type protein [Phlyctochytrium arcticum]|nr:armadillo-type protein [Phlyctochytrium arcticum]